MDIEFHYYITYIIAKNAGFKNKDAFNLAYASQYADGNDAQCTLNKGSADEYRSYVSQTMCIWKPQKERLRIYPCFHFIPGEFESNSGLRIDGKLHVLNTTPNSKNANLILSEALKTEDIYRIGLAIHSYADSWAHQNFVGSEDVFNG
jgi:hypothetical protein